MQKPSTKGKHIQLLLLEDTGTDAILIAHALAGMATVKTVEDRPSFEKALNDTVGARQFDAIMVDWTVPRFRGAEAIKLARRMVPEIPLIIVSGQITEEIAIEALKHGANDYVNKNKLGLLPETVKRTVEAARATAYNLRKQRLENIGNLATGIAHDLNNILGAQLLTFGILERTAIPAERKLIIAAQTSLKRGIGLVRHMVTFAKGDDDTKRPIDILPIIESGVEFVKATSPASVSVVLQRPASVPPIFGSLVQIGQVFQNIMQNARDACGDNPGKITVRVDQVSLHEMRLSTAPLPVSGAFVRVSIQDDGGGIPQDVLPHIFDSFYSTKETGHGIGLSTVRSIMDWHRGFIDVVTEMGKGTTFTVLFAVATVENVVPPLPDLKQGNGELIMVVEDEASALLLMEEILSAANYRVLGAHCGAQAYAVYKERAKEIAVAILDLDLPSIQGPDLAILLREINPAAKIIAISGSGSDPALAPKMRAEAFLGKPFSSVALLDKLAEVIAR